MAELNYHHLKLFRAVAREGHLTRAAEHLNLSQSALSTQIKTLESRLGHALFERRARQLHLTEAGRIALDHAETIFETGEDLLHALNQTGAAQSVLRVGAVSTLSRNFQLKIISPLLGRPDIEVVLRSGSPAELLPALEALQLDIVLTTQPPARDAGTALVAERLAEERVALVGTPARAGSVMSIAQAVADHPIVLPGRASSIRAGWDAIMEREGLRPLMAAEVDDMAMMRLLARQDAGLALVPPVVVQDELANGTLTEAIVPLPIVETFFAVTLRRRFQNPLVNEVLNHALKPQE